MVLTPSGDVSWDDRRIRPGKTQHRAEREHGHDWDAAASEVGRRTVLLLGLGLFTCDPDRNNFPPRSVASASATRAGAKTGEDRAARTSVKRRTALRQLTRSEDMSTARPTSPPTLALIRRALVPCTSPRAEALADVNGEIESATAGPSRQRPLRPASQYSARRTPLRRTPVITAPSHAPLAQVEAGSPPTRACLADLSGWVLVDHRCAAST